MTMRLKKCVLVIALLYIVSECVATGNSQGENRRSEPIPDLNEPAAEEMEESRIEVQDPMHEPIGSKQSLHSDEEWIEIWRKNHKKELKKQQRIRYNTKLNNDPARKAALRASRQEKEKGWRLQRKERIKALPAEERKASLDRTRLMNNESARKRRTAHYYGGFSTRKEQERNRLRELERSGKATSSQLEKLKSLRHEERLKYHKKAQRKKELKNAKAEDDGTVDKRKNRNG
ncbi:uncharacterized protein FA14DRAFT_158461 [Meira miltonrushii]|uniref:Uncharacterized protein n=1 Tax=Meira miltonrushii TaxID=1280837 RepID=A0A316V3S6_9BASI|nr:uncharacterized protein FA14DRAFT_158461 [Meira miltonrushii]PWN31648.1 hypothetical protein FA14DRAFT_158461 [Meira miltonrushii]